MAQDNDEINEARRKAMRNGEEDPVVVAQRYLNIYRQMHIFPPERKEAFDKMLVEIPADIRSILGSLPGGLMLQDYIGDLIEKQGGKPIAAETATSSDKPILETVLEQNKSEAPQVQPAPIIQGGNMEISLGKDFAEQFAGAFNSLLEKQNNLHKENLEKISADLNRSQQELAQYISKNQENDQKIFVAIAKALEHHQAQPQAQPAVNGGELNADQSLIMQQLIEGQKEINLRLNKMETTSLNHGNESNQELINALIKSNTEAMQKFASIQQTAAQVNPSVSSVPTTDNTEHILNLIEQSQARLIEGVTERILQNNLAQGQSQTANNANNIQINTPDTSAQTIMLVNKIADLQTANEKNMENAINRLIEAQKEIYTAIDTNRSQEIADAIVKGLKSSSLTINNYVPPEGYVPQQVVETHQPISTQTVDDFEIEPEPIVAPDNIPTYSYEEVVEQPKKKKKKKKKKKEPVLQSETDFEENDNNYLQEKDSENYFDDSAKSLEFSDSTATINDAIEKKTSKSDDNIDDNNNQYTKHDFNLTEKKFVETFPDSDDVSSVTGEISVSSSGSDWGFGETEDNTISSTALNDVENIDVDEVETIGADSYIYADDLSKSTDVSSNSPVIYNMSHPQIKVIPQIYDDADDEEKDPYIK